MTTFVKWPNKKSGVFISLEDARALELDWVMYGNAFVEVFESGLGHRISPEQIERGDVQIEEDDLITLPVDDDGRGDAP